MDTEYDRTDETLGGQQLACGPVARTVGIGKERDADDWDGERVLRRGDGVQAGRGDERDSGLEAIVVGQFTGKASH